ncbi:MAG: N-6 DNA methylase [Chlorobi bacterium]|nr:N-6 DNA methylase [Chlorobiota bacterium]
MGEDRNFLDAIIGLPANLFYGEPIPTSILVFKKCRENPENVLFIDSSKHFERGTQNILRPEDIERIIATYRLYTNRNLNKLIEGNIDVVNGEWQNKEKGNFKFVIHNSQFIIDKYSYLAPLTEIHENEYNLNIPRYVNTFEEEEKSLLILQKFLKN